MGSDRVLQVNLVLMFMNEKKIAWFFSFFHSMSMVSKVFVSRLFVTAGREVMRVQEPS